MMAITCSQNIDKARVIALYDNALSDGEATQLRSHLQSCPSCGAYFDLIDDNISLLSNHRLPTPMERLSRQDQLWLNLQHQIVQRKKRNPIISLVHNNGIRWLGAIAATLALVIIFAQVFHVFGPQQQNALSSSPIHFTSSVAFTPFYVSSHGDEILGVDSGEDASQPASAIYDYRLADADTGTSSVAGTVPTTSAAGSSTDFNMAITTLYTVPKNQAVFGDPISDGRYLAWEMGPQQGGNTSASLSLQVMDFQTGQTLTLANQGNQNGLTAGDYGFQLAHGNLFWQDMTTRTLKMHDLATGTTRTLTSSLAQSSDATGPPNGIQVSWPYILYPHADGHEHLLTITTGQDVALPDPPTPSINPHDNGVFYQIAGTTVIASWLLDLAKDRNSIRFASYDLAGTAHSWNEITTIDFYDFNSSAFSANDRLLLFTGKTLSAGQQVSLIWDRQLGEIVNIAPYLSPGIGNVTNAYLLGKWLVLTTGVSPGGGMNGAMIDTTHFVPPPR
jgi:hypothetical protein